MTDLDWASRLAAAIERELGASWVPDEPQVHVVRVTSPEEVEVVYSAPGGTELRGIRVRADVVWAAPERISESTVEEVAFDIVTTGIIEPRPASDYLPPDPNGVRWLSIPDWLAEVT